MVKNLLSILNARQTNILSGASILMLTVFATKFLGLIRDRLLVHQFNTEQAAIFFAAFRLPDLIFQLLIFGALSVAFIPVFTEQLHEKGEAGAFDFANNILNLALVLFGVVALVCFIFVAQINSVLVPGFGGQEKELTDYLSRIILLGQIILVIGSFFVGISQSFQRFIIPSLAPLFYNLGIVFGIAFLSPVFGIAGPAFGVVIGAALHVLVQFPLVNSLGFRYKLTLNVVNSGVKEVMKLMSYRNLGLAIEQLNETVGLALASLVSYSSVTILTFAQHLQVVPIGLFGATIAQAALPVLSRAKSTGQMEEFKATLLTTMHQILFLVLPSTAILIVLRIPVVRLTFGAQQFNWVDTVLTGRTLAFLALGLSAQSLVLLIVRGFYALKDTKTPVIVTVVTVTLNVILSYVFIRMFHWEVWGLGLSFSLATNLSLVLLMIFMNRKVGGFNLRRLLSPAFKMALAAAVAALALYIPIKALDQVVVDTTRTVNLIVLTGIASAFGIGIYILLVWMLQIEELYGYANLVKRVLNWKLSIRTKELPPETGGTI